jgi:hypothetical protein
MLSAQMGNQSSGSNGAAATSSKAAPGSPAKPSPAKKRKWDPETEKKFDETNLTGFFDSLAAFKPESKRQLLAFLASNDEAFEIRTGAWRRVHARVRACARSAAWASCAAS